MFKMVFEIAGCFLIGLVCVLMLALVIFIISAMIKSFKEGFKY